MLSIVIPVYNEEESLPSLYSELQEVLSSLNIQYEIIFINDGSTDKSLSVLKEIYSKDSSHIKIIDLRRNFGQTAALLAGFQHARGDLVLSLDADGQNDPHDIPLLLNTLTEEIDVICGWRYPRHDPFFRKILPSRVSNFLNRKINNLDIHDSGCTLRLYRVEAVKNLSLMRGEHRYIPAILSHQGFNISEVKVNHRPRVKGKSKYGPETQDLLTALSEAFTGLDVEGAVRVYSELEPLIDEAQREIAPPGVSFRVTMKKAIDHLLAVPVLQSDPPLDLKVVTYSYQDPSIEGLSEAQKQLLRMGPENVMRVQAKLRELEAGLARTSHQ